MSKAAEQVVSVPPDYRRPRSMRVHRRGEVAEVVPLDEDFEYRIGRSAENTVVIEGDETVSRVHGRLRCDASGVWRYADQRSSNGSQVLPRERFDRGDRRPEDLVRPYEHVAVGVGDLILFAKGRSRIELSDELPKPDRAAPVRWASEAGKKLEASLTRAARYDTPVFLFGPSGAGKTFVARQIHARSKRSQKPFVVINCARLPRDVASLTSEFLGHVAGAFTGATQARTGNLVAAEGGTVFLDEIESLSSEGQGFLLDVVEPEGELRPLGAGPRSPRIDLDVRFISASKVPLGASHLRNDFCERLSGLSIEIPPLESRREDIRALTFRLLEEIRWPSGVRPSISKAALELLARRNYRGQIRELRDALTGAGNEALADAEDAGRKLADAVIGERELTAYFEGRNRAHERPEQTLMISREQVEAALRKRPVDITRDEVAQALRAAGGNQTHAAKALGMSLNTFKSKMRGFGLRRKDFLAR